MRINIEMATAGVFALLAVTACGREADKAAIPSVQQTTASISPDTASERTSRQVDQSAPAPAFRDGKPVWASSRRAAADDAARRQFERNGASFAAGSLDDYVAKAHAFIDSPPRDALTVVRANGDTLFYDPKGNVFAVSDRQGAPRTMFKPRDGMSYWTLQKQRLADGSSSRGDRRDRQNSGDDASG